MTEGLEAQWSGTFFRGDRQSVPAALDSPQPMKMRWAWLPDWALAGRLR
jgi:hypothetical protein